MSCRDRRFIDTEPALHLDALGRTLRARILQCIGIPVGVDVPFFPIIGETFLTELPSQS